jgi:O-antigen/teichoic acid export membrane protein
MDKKQMFKGLMIVSLLTFLVAPFTFLIRIIFSRTLGVENYGLFYAMINFVLLVGILIDLGLGSSLTHYFSKFLHKEKYSLIKKSFIQVFSIQLILSLIIISLILLFRNLLSIYYFHTLKALMVIPIFALLFLFSIFYNLIVSFFMGVNGEKFYASMNPIRLFLVLIFSSISLLFFKGNFLIIFSIIWVASYLIISILYLFVAKINYPLIFKSTKTKESYLKPLIKYASMVILGTSAFFLLGRIDSVMLTFFKGVKAVGLYEVILPAASLILLFTTPLKSFLFPTISKLKHLKDTKHINFLLKAIYNLGLFLSLPITIIFFFFAYEILILVFGKDYSLAAIPLKILVIGFLFKSFTFINFAILQGLGKVKKIAMIIYFGVILNIVLNTILIPKQFFGVKLFNLGIIGAALSTSVCFLIMLILSLVYIQKDYIVSYKNWWKIIILNIILIFGMIYLLRTINLQIYLKIAVISLIAGLTYLLLGFIWKIVNYKELIKLIKKDETVQI